MHEHHIVESIVKQAIEKAKESHALKVSGVVLVMGELSGFKEQSVRFYFENLSKGTLLEGAELVVKSLPAKLKCQKCGIIFEHKKVEFNCPECRTSGVLIESGRELYIESLEIDA